MIPGFLSDVAALALLVPAARRHLRAYIQDNTELFSQKKGQNSDILEGEFERVEEDAPKITSDRT